MNTISRGFSFGRNAFSLALTICIVGFFFVVNTQEASAALPAGFQVETVTAGLYLPTAMAFAPDGRVFVAEKLGRVRVIKNGELLAQPLIELTDINTYADRGLIGIAVDPNFATNHYLYLSYTYENSPGSNFTGRKTARIVRITVNGDTASEASKLVIIGTVGGDATTPSCEDYAVTADCVPSDSSSHSAGALHFGPDGKLYATLGEGASFDIVDPRSLRAQNLDSLGGKMLRINTDGTGPADNPFYNGNPNSNRSKVYAYGLRNMFRFAFHPQTGAIYGGDVGWDTWEEINRITAGGNYGWPCREGDYQAAGQTCTAQNYINPFYSYVHDLQIGGSVTLGAFPNTGVYPAAYTHKMFFGDFSLNWVKTVDVGANDTFGGVADFMSAADGADGPVDFEVGLDGHVYYISIYTGELRRIVYTLGNRQPIAQIAATPTAGSLPLVVNFSSVGSSDPDGNPLTYTWNFGDGATSSATNPQHTYTVNGTYIATLTVRDGQGGINIKSATVHAGNRAPTPTITSPFAGSLYVPDTAITVTGSATDPESGLLTGTALSWRVILHHNTHIHILETHTGTSFELMPPDHGDPVVFTEIELTATDPGGASTKTSINIYLNNGVSADGNLVQNPSFETIDPLNPNKPNLWYGNSWGVNTAVYSYPVAGQSGTSLRGAKVTMSGYVSGDAKWVFDPAFIAPNTSYHFSNYYTATVPTRIIAAVVLQDGTDYYDDLATLPATGNWTKTDITYVTPPNAKSMVIYHIIESNGALTVDNFSLTPTSVTPPPPPTPTNLIQNPSLETAAGALPASWASNKWGTNTAVFTYPVAGQEGAKAARVAVSGYTSGDAKWMFNDVTVTPGTVYTFSDYYTSTAVTYLVARFKSSTGVYTYLELGQVPASAAWVQTTKAITIPANVTGLSVFHLLRSNGTLTVDTFGLNNGTVVPPPPPTPTNLITNGFFETVSTTTPTQPLGWAPVSIGGITTTFTYPTTGVDGGKAAAIQITNYPSGADGNARWQFTDVPITTGTQYTYEGYYTGSTISDIIGRYTFNDGSEHYFGLKKEIPAAADWTPITGTFVGPVNVKSVTLMHLISTKASLGIDNARMYISGTGTPNEIIPPTESFTYPTDGATVSGVITLTATATDNVGVAGLFFAVDGTPLGPEMLAPFTFTWDSRTVANGPHTLKVTARDAVGNNSRQIITVIVDNSTTPPPTPTNLIQNPSLETAVGALPASWASNKWGTNTAVFTYPVAGQEGAKAARVAVSGYTSGDAKWMFNDVTVTPGTVYTFSDYYTSTAVTYLVARFKSNTGAYSYVELGQVPASAAWVQTTKAITIPANVTGLSVFHLLRSNGTLTVDTFGLNNGTVVPPPPSDTTAPTVSITTPNNGDVLTGPATTVTAAASDTVGVVGVQFILDGVTFGSEDATAPYTITITPEAMSNGAHTLLARAHDAAGNTATSAPVTITIDNVVPGINLIQNPSLEQSDALGNVQNWNTNTWGVNTPVFTYPVAGQDGLHGAETTITSYTSGDAKWYFDDVATTPGQTYTYSEYSKATVPTSYVIRYENTDGTYAYDDLGAVPASDTWQKFTATFVPPSGTVGTTVFHIVNAVGTLAIDNVVIE